MFDILLLQSAFESLVGIRQPNTPGIPLISAPLSDSETGIYVDDKNPLASTDNVYLSFPNFEINVYPRWGSGNNYSVGVPVSDLGILYICLVAVDNDTEPPASDPTTWGLYNPSQIRFQQKYNQAVSNLFLEVVRKKKLLKMGKSILDRTQLYRGGGSIHQKIIPEGRFVGFEIYPQQAEGLWIYIDQVGLQATEVNPEMRYYLYHCDKLAPEGSWSLNLTLVNTFEWKSLTDPNKCILKYLSNNTSGVYYFGYYEEDIIGNAISKQWNCSTTPCIGCDGLDTALFNQWSRYVTLRNISVPNSALDVYRNLFDTTKITYGNVTNWGLNLSLTVRCDLTDFIIYNKYQFSDAFAFQLCKEFLSEIANSTRINPNDAQTKLSAISALDRKAPGNWIQDYDEAIQALNLDMSGFSKACMCDDNTKKVKSFVI